MSTKVEQTYNQLQQELDGIISDLQDGSIDVDASIAKYERGQVIIKLLQDYLVKAEKKITKIKLQK